MWIGRSGEEGRGRESQPWENTIKCVCLGELQSLKVEQKQQFGYKVLQHRLGIGCGFHCPSLPPLAWRRPQMHLKCSEGLSWIRPKAHLAKPSIQHRGQGNMQIGASHTPCAVLRVTFEVQGTVSDAGGRNVKGSFLTPGSRISCSRQSKRLFLWPLQLRWLQRTAWTDGLGQNQLALFILAKVNGKNMHRYSTSRWMHVKYAEMTGRPRNVYTLSYLSVRVHHLQLGTVHLDQALYKILHNELTFLNILSIILPMEETAYTTVTAMFCSSEFQRFGRPFVKPAKGYLILIQLLVSFDFIRDLLLIV